MGMGAVEVVDLPHLEGTLNVAKLQGASRYATRVMYQHCVAFGSNAIGDEPSEYLRPEATP